MNSIDLKEKKNKSNTTRSKSLNKQSKLSKPPTSSQTTKSKKSPPQSKTKSSKNSKEKSNSKSKSKSIIKNYETQKIGPPNDTNLSKNIDILQKLINNSQSILSEQNTLAERFSEITKRFTSSDYEFERLTKKNESDDLEEFLKRYGYKLNQIVSKLNSHGDEVEDIKYIKEENRNLKYKIELMSIDQNDYNLQYETKYNSLKKLITEELNSFNFLSEFGVDYPDEIKNFSEEVMAVCFQNVRKAIRNFKYMRNEKEANTNSNVCNQNVKRNFKNSKEEENNLERNPNLNLNPNRSGHMASSLNSYDYEKEFRQNDFKFLQNRNRDLEIERQQEDFKRDNYSYKNMNTNLDPNLNLSSKKVTDYVDRDFVSFRPIYEKDIPKSHISKEFIDRKYPNNEIESNMVQSNTSLENFRRNKDFRQMNRTNNVLNSEENLKLENRYSDSYFYKNLESMQDNQLKQAEIEYSADGDNSLDNKNHYNNRINYIPYERKYGV